jgi:predicted transcriptional regulator
MSTLHVRSVPDDLYTRVQELARRSSRSLSAQVVTMLYQAIEEEEYRHQQGRVLRAIRRRRFVPPQGTPTSVDLLRKDRQR